MRDLRWTGTDTGLSAVDYRNMGPEELGSIYESLLELVPEDVDLVARRFDFIGLTEEGSTAGHARKTTGSYYTPDFLVVELIKTALDPGHRAMRSRSPRPARGRPAQPCRGGPGLRQRPFPAGRGPAVGRTPGCPGGPRWRSPARGLSPMPCGGLSPHCIYGVDKNHLALELARTALWLEGFEPGLPLSFLDHHLIQGDSLVGLIDLRQMTGGIPDEAFKPPLR